jgi:hypothetical protein
MSSKMNNSSIKISKQHFDSSKNLTNLSIPNNFPAKSRQEDLPKSTFAKTAENKSPFSQTHIMLATKLNTVKGQTPLDDYLTTSFAHENLLQGQHINEMH